MDKIQRGVKYMTRDGRYVTIVKVWKDVAGGYPVLGTYGVGHTECLWGEFGHCLPTTKHEHHLDLLPVIEEITDANYS